MYWYCTIEKGYWRPGGKVAPGLKKFYPKELYIFDSLDYDSKINGNT